MRSMGQRKSDPGSLAFSRGPVQGVHYQQGFGGGGGPEGEGGKKSHREWEREWEGVI